MESVVNKLTEIENAASAIVRHAEEQKEVLNQEYEKKRRDFDEELERATQKRLDTIRQELELRTSDILGSQNTASEDMILSLQEEYKEKHTQYAQEILRRITEV